MSDQVDPDVGAGSEREGAVLGLETKRDPTSVLLAAAVRAPHRFIILGTSVCKLL
jgi:hypothetical protein